MNIEMRISADAVREMCIKNKLFTHGTSNEYCHVIYMIHEDDERPKKAEDVERYAEAIAAHSGDEVTARYVEWLLLNDCAKYFPVL